MSQPSMKFSVNPNEVKMRLDGKDLKPGDLWDNMVPMGLPKLNEVLNGGMERGQFFTRYGMPSSRGTMMFGMLNDRIRNTAPNTIERYLAAVALLKMMGCGVKWDGSLKVPEVSWFDTEGGMENFNQTIQDMFHGPQVMAKPDHERLGEHFYQRLSDLQKEVPFKKHRIQIDSLSDDV